jgi:two-component system, NtrC family, sensor histidine kinase HydH
MLLAGTTMLPAFATPDVRFLFLVNLAAVVAVTALATVVISTVIQRRYARTLEEQRMATIGSTTARILHQIKNPVQSLLLQAELLEEFERDGAQESRREAGQAIISEAMRLATMLNELSGWSSGIRRPHVPKLLPVHELLRELGGRERMEAARGGIRLDIRIGAEAEAPIDEYYFSQAVENLLRNAREALRGQPDARIQLELERDGGFAAIHVTDNGPGIPADRLGTVFEPFVSTKGSGMGLGLPISREIAERHGGTLTVRSEPGEGTTFTLRVPLASQRGTGARKAGAARPLAQEVGR